MQNALYINLAIIGIIVLGLILTYNPLFILGCFFLVNMPFFGPQPPPEDEDPEYDESRAGFTADIK